MNTHTNHDEIKQFLTLRSKLWDEMEELQNKLDALDEEREVLDKRHTEIQNILDGSVQGLELLQEEEPADEREQMNQAVLKFLIENPASSTKEIVEGLSEFGPDVPYKVSHAIKRLKRRDLVVRTGTTRNAVWSASEDV